MTSAAAIGVVAAASIFQQSSSLGNLALIGAMLFAAWAVWRTKSGDFYKSVAAEKKEQNEQLRSENEKLRELTDITPIVEALHGVTAALERHAEMTAAVFSKVQEMNGSLRATTTAMQALGDRLVRDEAARALLHTAAERTSERKDM